SGYEFGEMICAMPPEQRFTGVFCTAGLMAPGMVDALVTGGLTIPEDVSVVISDDANTHTQAAELTAVDQNPHAMGAAAVELLLERLKNPSQPPRRIIYPPILTERGSVRVLTQP
ncbi:MAG: substrate-binding domain-containing protein, partial [Oscillospiraceae bacterium]